jgi:hypothetical protein
MKSYLKQYIKGGRVLGTEACINDPHDFMIKKSLVRLGTWGVEMEGSFGIGPNLLKARFGA